MIADRKGLGQTDTPGFSTAFYRYYITVINFFTNVYQLDPVIYYGLIYILILTLFPVASILLLAYVKLVPG
jgi:hypothetical protein